MKKTLILASASPWRCAMLEQAGLSVLAEPANIDERAIDTALEGPGTGPDDLALILAEAKAMAVSERHPDALVLGADQVLSLEGETLHKSRDFEEARRRLLQLSGKTHRLNSGLALCRGGKTLWRHVSVAEMTMRDLDPGFIGRYLALAGQAVLGSVGAYQIEGPGIQLFERIDGDYWTIVGLPLLPLLTQLRAMGAIDD
ncbi:septum formation protein Maf [Notoacmeibacter marinus]|uniref:7-methyl-GTP pyrophosphatase n=1 Tax=Notoacmeibacter marinus TaxID=1876515 RepID=A0A231V224_9HYPH|nr:Maf-like protein [Notoacmeibacter marinus]OXT02248.1 septum formation protein Maf [Notoacmeibacter marinus]